MPEPLSGGRATPYPERRLERFDPCGQLPGPGVTVLEASAGTGKTFAIASLLARFVASGTPLDEVLAVTFTRMATGELRERVRDRLVSIKTALERHQPGRERPAGDDVAKLLAEGPPEQVGERLRLLAAAVANFDAATITTTHGFCHLVLAGLGSAGDLPSSTGFLEDPSDLLEEVVADLYLRRVLRHGRRPPFTQAEALAAATELVCNPGVEVVPQPDDSGDGLLRRLATRAAAEVARRLQERDLLTYDALLERLAETLGDPERGEEACLRLRRRWSVVLVDEFQDTDPLQWQVVRRAFGEGSTTLVLVGDPRQAIYSFRGADVHAYLEARRQQGARTYMLDCNWRSDQALLDALRCLLEPLELGHPEIRFEETRAPASRPRSGIRGLPEDRYCPLRLRLVADDQRGISLTANKRLLLKAETTTWVASDVAAEIARLLGEASVSVLDDSCAWRSLEPRDIAVLTRTNKQAVTVREALRRAGIASVVAGTDSVFATEGASGWLELLQAVEEPASRSPAAALALSPFIGKSPAELATGGEAMWEEIHSRIHEWSSVLSTQGPLALYRAITDAENLPARLLAKPGGERLLTDLGHVAELLGSESPSGAAATPALRAWLAKRIARAGNEATGAEERTRRLDTDSQAVQVVTVHRAKGLEFAVVYCPYLWDPPRSQTSGPQVFHDPAAGARTLDVGHVGHGEDRGAEQRYQRSKSMARAEQMGEDLRLMYVALTRARHQVVLWWARASGCGSSSLGRLLVFRDRSTGTVGPGSGEPSYKDVKAALDQLRAPASLIGIEEAGSPIPQASRQPSRADDRPGSRLEAASFSRSLDLSWCRSSYSGIVGRAHAVEESRENIGSEPEDPGVEDEPVAAVMPATGAAEPSSEQPWPASPLDGLPGGREVGTFVHSVLEASDFSSPDLEAEIEAAVRSRRWAPQALEPGVLARGLAEACSTPLDPLLPGTCLRDFTRGDRLDELGFELPLAGGDHPNGSVATSLVASLLEAHLPPGGTLVGYPERLRDPLLQADLHGYLTGSLDLVLRRREPHGVDRWYVVDYKTNWLGEEAGPLTAWHYRPEALDAEMQRRHYPLQALLYLVALHRYLRWRLPGYSPHRSLGGVLYLFLRGMVGPNAPFVEGRPCGVFSWAPPPELVVELSQLFHSPRRP